MESKKRQDKPLPPLGAQRAADTVVSLIERDIASGQLTNGSPLPPERELMGRFGVSRTVVREAIAALTTQGLLDSKPRFRPIVRSPGYDTAFSAIGGVVGHLLKQSDGVKTLYDVRIFLEASLARNAALHARKDDIAALRQALADNFAALDDPVLFDNTDAAFHAVFYSIPRNPIFPAVHSAFVNWLFDHWQSMDRTPERNLVYYNGHKAIFDAVIDRDPDRAESALLSHLNQAWETVRGTF